MRLDTRYLELFINKKEFRNIQQEVSDAHAMLVKGTGLGSDYHGWVHLPSKTKKKQLMEIEETARRLRNISDVFIVIGIGGSYLGSRAAIEFLCPGYRSQKPAIYFLGNNLDPCYLKDMLGTLNGKDISLNVISKSGTTTEPAIAFRVLKKYLSKKYSSAELRKRIVCTTTKGKGALYAMAKEEGYKCFYIPQDVGGRFSILSPVGLFPMAVAGIEIQDIIKGALDVERKSNLASMEKNLSNRYAALRNLLYRNGKAIEIMSSFHVRLFFLTEWWKQLFAESEGKDGRGLFTTTAMFSTDLHSIGQLIQEGERNIFETFIRIRRKSSDLKIPFVKDNLDNLNYIAGKGVDFVNRMAYKGTALAHSDGQIPNMTIDMDEASAFCFGQMIYFFQRAVGVSGYLLGINPFDQPGVEAYKNNMFELLGKPGF